jgi:hypothetical protein
MKEDKDKDKVTWDLVKWEIILSIVMSLFDIFGFIYWIVIGDFSNFDILALGGLTVLCLLFWIETLIDLSKLKNEN